MKPPSKTNKQLYQFFDSICYVYSFTFRLLWMSFQSPKTTCRVRNFNFRSKCASTKAVPASDSVTIQLTTEAETRSRSLCVQQCGFSLCWWCVVLLFRRRCRCVVLLLIATAAVSCTHSFHNRVNQYSKRF